MKLTQRSARPLAVFVVAVTAAMTACQQPAMTPPPQAATAPPPGYPQPAYGAPPGYPPQQVSPGYPQAAPTYAPVPTYSPAPAPAPTYAPAPPAAPQSSPASYPLGMLVGAPAWQAEVRAVVRELVANLSADYQARVATVPIVFDPNANDVNAYASCDKNDAPFVAATEGLLDAADAIAETKATDEIFGTHTYDAYSNLVVPKLASQAGGSALLPPGLIAPQYWLDQRRITRAHQIFDETVAFTFGHELSHHYLGHTGCAMGQANPLAQGLAQLGQFLTSGAPPMNQPNEAWADTYGCRNTLDTGLARSRSAYRWTEEGGLFLLDFFDRLMRASGASPLVSILLSHPAPQLRISLVQTTAATWRLQHPGQ
jgi:hypothetical protein